MKVSSGGGDNGGCAYLGAVFVHTFFGVLHVFVAYLLTVHCVHTFRAKHLPEAMSVCACERWCVYPIFIIPMMFRDKVCTECTPTDGPYIS